MTNPPEVVDRLIAENIGDARNLARSFSASYGGRIPGCGDNEFFSVTLDALGMAAERYSESGGSERFFGYLFRAARMKLSNLRERAFAEKRNPSGGLVSIDEFDSYDLPDSTAPSGVYSTDLDFANELMARLSERDRKVLELFYGLNGNEEHHDGEIALHPDVRPLFNFKAGSSGRGREAVRQARHKAISRLQEMASEMAA